jgi:hypothetical protein
MEAQSLRGISAGLNSIFRKLYNNMTDQPSFEGSYRLYLYPLQSFIAICMSVLTNAGLSLGY